MTNSSVTLLLDVDITDNLIKSFNSCYYNNGTYYTMEMVQKELSNRPHQKYLIFDFNCRHKDASKVFTVMFDEVQKWHIELSLTIDSLEIIDSLLEVSNYYNFYFKVVKNGKMLYNNLVRRIRFERGLDIR